LRLSSRTLNWFIIGYWSIVLLLSVVSLNGSINLNESKVVGFRSDYLLHMLLFIPWMILAKWRWKAVDGKSIFWLTIGIGILLAGISEAVQLFVPDRTFNMLDLAANCVGIVAGAVIAGWGRAKKVASR
jgi:glycopeptide antibiotics resistance protein